VIHHSVTPSKNDAPKFIAVCHLGKLAKYLRLIGFDTLFFPHIEDDKLITIANEENRIYWQGDHYKNMMEYLAKVLKES